MENTVIQANPNFIYREIGGEHILIPIMDEGYGSEMMFTLNETGSFIWDKVQNPITLEELIQLMKEEFEGDESIIEEDTKTFVAGMIQLKFILEGNE